MTNEDWYWLIGLLEGEGCFTRQINKSRPKGDSRQIIRPYYSLRIALLMTDLDIVEKAYKLFKCGYITKTSRSKINPKHKDVYTWCINGPKAEEWMLKLKPFMGQRRQLRIQELLEEKKLYPVKFNRTKFCIVEQKEL